MSDLFETTLLVFPRGVSIIMSYRRDIGVIRSVSDTARLLNHGINHTAALTSYLMLTSVS